ncbi:MAG TPA: class I mannose-6-phosphate isomerase [Actinocatenispora sp.]
MPDTHRSYEANPRYAAVGGDVRAGWRQAVDELPAGTRVLAVDGPWLLDWDAVVKGLTAAVPGLVTVDVRDHLADWATIGARTDTSDLTGDPHFAKLSDATLADFFADLPTVSPADTLTVVFGPGAALVAHDTLWYADLPKRYAEAAIGDGTGTNLGQPAGSGAGTTRRLFYIDWPILDRHRDELAPRLDRYLDTQQSDEPVSLSGAALRGTAEWLAQRPFRTRPTFNTTPWGGQWARTELGFNPDAQNTALGYELIAPESGVLVGTADAAVELPFQVLVALHPERVLGAEVHRTFGTSFPIRFDYLDTVAGGNLSVHCHPQSTYMSEVFGWPYTQHETYYMMVGSEQNTVYLGLREGVDVEAFQADAHAADHAGTPFDITTYVQTFPAEKHQLFLIPGGTPHGSGKGNVVLEVSATPYLYSLRFYDWLRRDAKDRQRAVHVEHAFRNLNTQRTGEAVGADLVQSPRTLRDGAGWREELLGELPEMFFTVHRVDVSAGVEAPDDTAGRFHVINVVEGDGVVVRTASGAEHRLNYAETLVLPAAVGRYTLTGLGAVASRVVKAYVR